MDNADWHHESAARCTSATSQSPQGGRLLDPSKLHVAETLGPRIEIDDASGSESPTSHASVLRCTGRLRADAALASGVAERSPRTPSGPMRYAGSDAAGVAPSALIRFSAVFGEACFDMHRMLCFLASRPYHLFTNRILVHATSRSIHNKVYHLYRRQRRRLFRCTPLSESTPNIFGRMRLSHLTLRPHAFGGWQHCRAIEDLRT